MKPRNTAILFLVAVLLGGIVWYSNRQQAQKVEAEATAKKLFGDLQADSVEWIEVHTSDGKDARLERTDGVWHVTKPVLFPADATNADAIASALAGLSSEGVIEDAQAPDVYGLGDGANVLRFRAAGVDHELRTGKKTPIGANNYASTGAGPVYTVATFRVTSLEKSLDDLRERRPLRFDREGIQRIEATWVDGGVVLEKKDGKWRLVAPLDAEADSETVETLLSDLVFLRATGFVDAPPPDKEVGLDAPQYRVVLIDAAEEGKQPLRHEVAIGGVLEGGKERAARGAESALYKIPNERFDALPKSVVAFRWKSLSNFVATDAQRFEISFADASAKGSSQAVTISGESGAAGWTTQPDPMGPGLAARIVAELARLKADDIAAEKMGDAELAAVGLAPPRATVRVLGKPPEAGGDAPELARIYFGIQKGNQIFAQVPGRETVYRVAGAFAEHVPLSLEAFHNRFVAKEPPPQQPGAPAAAPPQAPGSDDESALPGGPADAGEGQVEDQ